jgi:hypothetical protein
MEVMVLRSKLSLAALAIVGFAAAAPSGAPHAENAIEPERVRGFFCNAKSDSLDFLLKQASGENEEIAANLVNKRLGTFSCAYYLPANAVYTGEHTVIQDGLVFKLHSYMFLPERVERWTGSTIGTLQPSPSAKHDV